MRALTLALTLALTSTLTLTQEAQVVVNMSLREDAHFSEGTCIPYEGSARAGLGLVWALRLQGVGVGVGLGLGLVGLG